MRDGRGHVATTPELRQPVLALSLGGVRRRIEALMLPDDVHIVLHLDRAARLERDRATPQGRGQPRAAVTAVTLLSLLVLFLSDFDRLLCRIVSLDADPARYSRSPPRAHDDRLSVSRRWDVAGRGIAVQAREGGCSPVGGLSVRKRRLPDAHAAKPRGAPDFHR
jgi:hypothetical protein